jgi:hypothetical protein
MDAHIFKTPIIGNHGYGSTTSLEKKGGEVRENEDDNDPLWPHARKLGTEYGYNTREADVDGCAEKGRAYSEGYEIPNCSLEELEVGRWAA